MEPLDRLVDELVSHIGRLSPEDEAVQNDTISVSSDIEAIAKSRKADRLTRVTRAFNAYVKKLAAGEITGNPPLEEKRGIVVEELLGKEEFVIKSLGANLENIPGFSGGAILGDGRPG